jgi:hypothetical protein
MAFLRAVFTRHLFAKVFALFFAVVTVYLVNRELETVWYERDFPVVMSRDVETMIDRGQPFVAMSLDPGVWVTKRPKSLRLRLSGSAKERVLFGARPMIELRVRSEWVDPIGAKDHGLVESDFEIPLDLSSAKIELLDTARFPVDLIEVRDRVKLRLKAPKALAGEKIFDDKTTRFEPPLVSVAGPRGVVRRLETADAPTEERLMVELETVEGEAYRAGQAYRVRLTKEGREKGLRLVETEVMAIIGGREEERETIAFENFPVQWRLRDKDLKLLAKGELILTSDATPECRIEVTGPKSRMAAFAGSEGRERLREKISAIIDPIKDVDALLPGDERGPNLEIEISGLPPGLSCELPDVKTITCRISLLEKG